MMIVNMMIVMPQPIPAAETLKERRPSCIASILSATSGDVDMLCAATATTPCSIGEHFEIIKL